MAGWLAGLTGNKTKPASWGLAINFPGRGGWLRRLCGGMFRRLCWVAGWVAGLTENSTKPASWGLAELGNKLSRAGWLVAQAIWWQVAQAM